VVVSGVEDAVELVTVGKGNRINLMSSLSNSNAARVSLVACTSV